MSVPRIYTREIKNCIECPHQVVSGEDIVWCLNLQQGMTKKEALFGDVLPDCPLPFKTEKLEDHAV